MTYPKNILIRMPNWIGDAVMGAPLPEDLKKQFPDTKITLMCQGVVGQLFLHDPFVDEILSFQKPSGWIHHLRPWYLIDDLKKGHYDCGILLTHSLSSAWTLFRGNVRNRIGFEGRGRSLFLNDAIPFPENKESLHQIDLYKELLKPLDIAPSQTRPKLYLSENEKTGARRLLEKEGAPLQARYIGINPGAAYGSAKCWLPERFRAVVLDLLKDPDNIILLFGDVKGKALTDEICKDLNERVFNLAGKTSLRELIAYIGLVDVLLTNDSGPMHIASALDTPVVALFGSTSAIKTGPYSAKTIVIHKHVECSPCYKRVCPIDFRCMKRIETDEVLKAIKEFLHEPRKN